MRGPLPRALAGIEHRPIFQSQKGKKLPIGRFAAVFRKPLYSHVEVTTENVWVGY